MANYNSSSMWGGVLGEELTAGTEYTFALQTFAYPSQSVYANTAYFMTDSSTTTNSNLQGSSTNAKVGALREGLIPLSNTVGSITGIGANSTFTFDVSGDSGVGSRGQIALTATAGTITSAQVTSGGEGYVSGDGITISQNDLQAAGFSNADASQQLDLFPDYIEGTYISSDFTGTFADFTNAISQSNFVSSSCGFAFNIEQTAANPQPLGEFKFTPTTTIPANSYLIKASGHFILTIA
jgi:hypothetical protein